MSRSAFIDAMTGLVREWSVDPATATKKLAEIYDEVRNSTAFELAEAVRQRGEALRQLHKKITTR